MTRRAYALMMAVFVTLAVTLAVCRPVAVRPEPAQVRPTPTLIRQATLEPLLQFRRGRG